MSEHHATISWDRRQLPFDYASYSRNHRWGFPNGVSIEASAAPAFRGDAEKVDPEEAFVASLASCHMLTFLALCARGGVVVETYEDAAVGFLERNVAGKLALTRIELRPVVTFADSTPVSAEHLASLHHQAHNECFLANSVHTDIRTIL